MNHAQGAQTLHQHQLASIERREVRVPLQHVRELLAHLTTRARQQHPQILHRRSRQAIVEVDEVRPRIRPQHVAAMTVAVQTHLRDAVCRIEGGADLLQQIRSQRFVSGLQMRRNPVAVEQIVARILPEPLDVDAAAMAKALPPADQMNAAEEAAHPLALGARAELGPAAAAALEHREAETLVFEQRAAVLHERRHDRNLRGRELQREAVLLGDRRGTPALRPVKLRDQRRAALDADLVHAVLVAVQRKDAPVGDVAERLHRRDDDVGREAVVRMRVAAAHQ